MGYKILFGVLLLGGLLISLVNAAGSVSTQSCWTPWDHNSDVRQWNQNEWVWTGIHGKVVVCNGKFQRIITDTVYGTATAKGMEWYRPEHRVTSSYAYYKVVYKRYSETYPGTAIADIPNYWG